MTRYRAGADFERKVRDALKEHGAIYVCRSAGSKGSVDLIAFYGPTRALGQPFPLYALGYGKTTGQYVIKRHERCWFVQAKRDGRISKADQWALCELARMCGAVPVLAKAGPRGTPVVLEILTVEKAA